MLPGLSSHEDSFLQRLEIEVEAKERLAGAALALIEPGEAVFIDSSTTGYADHAILSVRSITPDGVLTDPDSLGNVTASA